MKTAWKILLLAVGLAPAVGVTIDAQAEKSVRQLSPRQKVLARIPHDPKVLVNVTRRELPASPDLLHLGRRSTRALERCLADNVDVYVRMHCAKVLAALGDRRALPTLHTALEDWEAGVRLQVVFALRQMADPSSYSALLKLFQRKDEKPHIRHAVIAAMGAISNPKALAVLRKELRRKPKPNDRRGDFRASAFRALWRSRHLMARTTLESDVAHALKSDHDGVALAATEASAELRSRRLVRPLTALLSHQNAEIRNKAAYGLGRIGDRGATRALLAQLPKVREARMLNNISFALERLDRKAFYKAISKIIGHKQAVIRLNAAFVVGDVKRAEGLPVLEAALKDPSDFVRTSAIVAVGKVGDPRGVKLLEPFVRSANSTIRQEAIYSLHRLTGGKRKELIYDKLFNSRFAKSSRGHAMRRRAALVLGKAGDQRVRDYLLGCFESDGCNYWQVKPYLLQDKAAAVNGRLLLWWANGSYEVGGLVAQRRPSGTRTLAVSELASSVWGGNDKSTRKSIDLVGAVGTTRERARLRPLLTAKNTWHRVHAGAALLRLGDTRVSKPLLADFDNLPAEWLPYYVRVVGGLENKKAIATLKPELDARARSADVDHAAAARGILLSFEPETGFFGMLSSLASKNARERELAERYLRRNEDRKVTWVMRRALAREGRADVRDRLRRLLDERRE